MKISVPRPPLTAYFWASEIGVIQFYYTRQDVGSIPLPHGGTDAPEHRPCGIIGDSNLAGQQDGRDPALVLKNEIESQEPLAQADMAVVQDCSGCDGGLPVAVSTLI